MRVRLNIRGSKARLCRSAAPSSSAARFLLASRREDIYKVKLVDGGIVGALARFFSSLEPEFVAADAESVAISVSDAAAENIVGE